MYTQLQRATRAAVLVGCAVAAPACEVNLNTEGLTASETRTFAVTGQPEVTLDTWDGAIEIHSWDRNEVEVQIEKQAMDQALLDQMTIEAEQEGDRIVVRVTGPARSPSRGLTVGVHISPRARLLVALPRKSAIEARTGDGAIRVEDIDGRLVLRTGDGSVSASRVAGDLQIRTGDGAVRVEKAEGRLDLETDDGSIIVEARPSVLRARTGDGSIRLRVAPDTVMTDAWDLSTGDGSVTLSLPADFNAEVDAETSDGSVGSSHPALKSDEEGERRDRRRTLRTRMGDGGPILKVRTGDGSIRFES